MDGVENRFSASVFVSVVIGIVRRYSHFELVTAGKHELPTLLRSFKTASVFWRIFPGNNYSGYDYSGYDYRDTIVLEKHTTRWALVTNSHKTEADFHRRRSR